MLALRVASGQNHNPAASAIADAPMMSLRFGLLKSIRECWGIRPPLKIEPLLSPEHWPLQRSRLPMNNDSSAQINTAGKQSAQ
jgi:hypothetical protein